MYIIVRGHEVHEDSAAAAGLTLPSGFTVPPNAKLQLQRIDNVTFQPLDFVPLVTLPKGRASRTPTPPRACAKEWSGLWHESESMRLALVQSLPWCPEGQGTAPADTVRSQVQAQVQVDDAS